MANPQLRLFFWAFFGQAQIEHIARSDDVLSTGVSVDKGVLADAGCRGSEVIPDVTFTELFRFLHRSHGRVVELQVVDGDEQGPPSRTRPRRTLRFAVPTAAPAH